MTARFLCRLGLAFVWLAVSAISPAAAQTYPSNLIRVIVPSPAGTPPDIMGRIIANDLSESEG